MAIEHDEKGRRFVMALEDGQQAVLRYSPGRGVLDFFHVYVPVTHRGHGLAGRIVAHGFDYARRHGLKVLPTCPYVRQYAQRHPECQPLLAQG
jgi:predicted GNAT family acetyltransferase